MSDLKNTDTLLELLSRDDKAAFTEIYNHFWKKLFAIAYNRLRETEAAEDVVHDVFASLWTNRHTKEIRSLDNYLATAVKYLVLTRIRKKERERLYNKSLYQAHITEMPIENSLHYSRILEIVHREVENLPSKCKLVFEYSRKQGKPAKQIALELNISVKTVENQLNKALKQLKLATRSLFFLLIIVFSS